MSPLPKKALPAAAPKPAGMITATLARPRFTASRASASAGLVSLKFLSAPAAATIPVEIALLS